MRRSAGAKSFEIHIRHSTCPNTKKETFLSQDKNKQRFIDMLSERLLDNGIQVRHSDGDADVLIIKTAIEYMQRTNVILVADDDTDIFVLAIHYLGTNDFANSLLLKASSSSAKRKLINVTQLRSLLHPDICSSILLIHAYMGCDTTSGIFRKSKKLLMKQHSILPPYVEKFYNVSTRIGDLARAGEELMLSIYENKDHNSLDDLRYITFSKKVTSNTIHVVEAKSLPPTSACTYQHTLRVFHQIQAWLGVDLDPITFGWTVVDEHLWPVTTSKAIAPTSSSIIIMIKCSCKKHCDTNSCTCWRLELKCTVACANCHESGNCFNLDDTVNDSAFDDNSSDVFNNDTQDI